MLLSKCGAEKPEHRLVDRIGLLQDHEMSGTGNIYHLHPVTHGIAERVAIAGGGAALSSSPWTTSIGAVPAVHQSSNRVFWLVAISAITEFFNLDLRSGPARPNVWDVSDYGT